MEQLGIFCTHRFDMAGWDLSFSRDTVSVPVFCRESLTSNVFVFSLIIFWDFYFPLKDYLS